MTPDVRQPTRTYEVFIILEPFRERWREILSALGPLMEAAAEGPLLSGVEAYYRRDTDIALLAIGFDGRTLSDRKLTFALELCARAELLVLDPGRLSPADRRSFYDDYLSAYEVRVVRCDGPAEALAQLTAELGLEAPRRRRPAGARAGAGASPGSYSVARPAAGKGRTRARRQDDTAPLFSGGKRPPLLKARPPAPPLYVRFLRGDEWISARIRSVSLREARVATGALPRLHDEVHVAIAFADLGAVVSGHVVDVIGPDHADACGSPGFRIAFPDEDGPARRQLAALLRAAREAGISLERPPQRSSVRFPIRWPIQVSSNRKNLSTAVLDISTGGLFVAASDDLGDDLLFRLPTEDNPRPIHGRARIARAVDEQMAEERGLTRGFGLEIVDLFDDEGDRYRRFLDRIGQRSDKRVVVAAAGDRRRDLRAGLSMAGYAASGRSDTSGLIDLVELSARPPDAAILDASLGSPAEALRLRSVLGARGVPCLATSGERPEQARLMVDRVLAIAH